LTVDRWRLAVGGWRLAVGGWRLAVGQLNHEFLIIFRIDFFFTQH
jgi:hypothetical protein